MVTLITGLIGALLVVVFLGYYAVMIGSIPLWIIVVVILVMAIFDFVQSIGKGKNESDD